MRVTPNLKSQAYQNGYDLIKDPDSLAVVGLSPRNSYFKRNTIDELLKNSASKFKHVRIMVADKPAEHTYFALGYDKKEAARKARLATNTLKNHSKRSLEQISGDVNLIEWSQEVEENPVFQDEYKRLLNLYLDNPDFKERVRETTKEVVQGEVPKEKLEQSTFRGIAYVLKELAFLSTSPKIFKKKVAYIYHERWPILEEFISGKFDGKKRKDLGMIVMK